MKKTIQSIVIITSILLGISSCTSDEATQYGKTSVIGLSNVSELWIMSRIEEDFEIEIEKDDDITTSVAEMASDYMIFEPFKTAARNVGRHFRFAQQSVLLCCYVDFKELSMQQGEKTDILVIRHLNKALKWKTLEPPKVEGASDKTPYFTDDDDYWDNKYNDHGNRINQKITQKLQKRADKDHPYVVDLAQKKITLFYKKMGYNEVIFEE